MSLVTQKQKRLELNKYSVNTQSIIKNCNYIYDMYVAVLQISTSEAIEVGTYNI